MRRARFPAGMAEIPDVDNLSVDDLKKLVFRVHDENAGLTAEIARLREEVARLKRLKGRPKIGASGMEAATDAPAKGGAAKTRWRGAPSGWRLPRSGQSILAPGQSDTLDPYNYEAI